MTENNPIVELHPKVLLDAALKYALRGFRVLPLNGIRAGVCTCGDTDCRSPGKHPLTAHGATEASADEMTIRGWWSKWPTANIGLAMGDAGCVALDVDTRNLGHLSWEALIQANGALPETPTQRSGNGWHYLVRIDTDAVRRCRGKLAPGIDVKANGYIVAEPSIHHSGRRYAWDDGLDLLAGFTPARAPVWLERMLMEPADAGAAPSSPNLGNYTLPVQLAEAAAALTVLDAEDYHQWIEAGMALHATGLGDLAYQVWVEWSGRSGKFDHKVQRSKWLSFSTKRSAGVTIKTLFSRAQSAGWKNPMAGNSSAPQASAPVSKLIAETGEAFVAGFKPPEYTIEGILLRGYLYGITGKSNAGKTAIAVSLAACVGAGKPFGRHQSVVGRVLYLAGENPEDIRLRIKAYCVSMFLPQAFNNVTFVSRSFSISQHFAELMELSESVGGFDLVLVDGKTSFFTGDEENDNTQAYAQALELRSLTRLVGLPSVAVLCHPNRAVEGAEGLLPRGGSAFLNELDGNLTAWNSGGVVSLSQNKIRGADFEPVKIKLDVFVFPDIKTNFGTPITSVIAKPLDMNESELLEEQAESEENRLLTLVNSSPKSTLREWAGLLGWNDRNGQPMVSKVSRTLSQLKADKMVRKVRKNWKITAAGKAEIGV
jgi:hypothetical protein